MKSHVLLQVERLQAQALGLMSALNEQGGGAAEELKEQLGAKEQIIAEKDEQLELANSQLEAMKEMMRAGPGSGNENEIAALEEELTRKAEALAERDEQLELANTQLEAMKEMMRAGQDQGAGDGHEIASLKEELAQQRQVLAERDEQLQLAHAQLEGMKEIMRTAEGGAAEVAALNEQVELSNTQLQAMKDMLRDANESSRLLQQQLEVRLVSDLVCIDMIRGVCQQQSAHLLTHGESASALIHIPPRMIHMCRT